MVRRSEQVVRAARRLLRRSSPADTDDFYGGAYFGEGRNPLDRMGLSGYERYARDTSNANIAAYLVWRHFPVERTLDVGCALGFVVTALREVGLDAHGCDLSQWAVEHAEPAVRPYLRAADLTHGLPYPDGAFELVTALETLEHLPPTAADAAARELARVSDAWVVCTIPSLGANDGGPDGFPNSKVRDDVLPQYLDNGRQYDGPVPAADLAVDRTGQPVEGHLTIASYRWWTARFAAAGMERRTALERRIHPFLARFDLTEFWNLYVFAHPGVPDPPPTLRTPAEQASVEARWRLTHRTAGERALMFLRAGLGEDAAAEPPSDSGEQPLR